MCGFSFISVSLCVLEISHIKIVPCSIFILIMLPLHVVGMYIHVVVAESRQACMRYQAHTCLGCATDLVVVNHCYHSHHFRRQST